jgi:GAF domain-containing protein
MSTPERIAGYFDALRETAHMLSGVMQESVLVDILLHQTVAALSLQKVLVLLPSRDAMSLMVAGATGFDEGALPPDSTPLDISRIDRRVLAGETVIVSDIHDEPDFHALVPIAEGPLGVVAVPMSVRGRVIGVLYVYCAVKEAIQEHPDCISVLGMLADLGGLALEKVRLHQALYGIAEAVSSTMDLPSMLQNVLKSAVEEMWLKAASIRLLDEKTQVLGLAAAYGLSEAYLAKGDIHLSKSEIDRRILKGEEVVLVDVERHPGLEYPAQAAQEGILSVIAVPLRSKGVIHGVMRAYSAQSRHFGPVAATFLKSVADLVSMAMENAELYSALKAYCKDLKKDLAEWHRFLALG